jgi:beta-lactam-binding protein with PASTA domain
MSVSDNKMTDETSKKTQKTVNKPNSKSALWWIAGLVVALAAVVLVVSLTNTTTTVPNVVGKNVVTAVQVLQDIGLSSHVEVTRLGPAHPPTPGTVISQMPPPGSSITSGGQVILIVFGRSP